ncbi:MAG: hypothetical protein ACI4TI_02430, partial [Christensenellales bacterium]
GQNMIEDFDNIEVKPENDLEVETNSLGAKKEPKPVVEKLKVQNDRKIEKIKSAQNGAKKSEKDNLKNFKKSRKAKKSLKKRVLAWGLGLSVLAGAGFGVTSYVQDGQTGNRAYVNEVKSRYEMVDKTLTNKLYEDISEFSNARDRKVNVIRFEKADDEKADIRLFYEAKQEFSGQKDFQYYGSALYSVDSTCYDAVVSAEESGNMIEYLDCLNVVFSEMELVSKNYCAELEDILRYNHNDIFRAAGNEIFALDFEQEGIVKQVGFLPLYIEKTVWESAGLGIKYTFRISGISYCQTTFESHDEVKKDTQYVGDASFDENHVKAYYRDFDISSFEPRENHPAVETQLQNDIANVVDGKKSVDEFEVNTTYFQDVNVYNAFEEYLSMQGGNFDYKKPENVDMLEYKK